MKVLLSSAALISCMLIACSPKDKSDDTLQFFLDKTELAVRGEIVSEPIGIVSELGVVSYRCEFKVVSVVKGDAGLAGETINVSIVRFESDTLDQSPLVANESDCILFLKKQGKGESERWTTADFWFGIQPPSPWMERSLTRLNDANPND